MHLKWFKGRAVPEVVSQIRKELGPEAVILHSKRSRGWGRSGDPGRRRADPRRRRSGGARAGPRAGAGRGR